jgi:hypothetical protein
VSGERAECVADHGQLTSTRAPRSGAPTSRRPGRRTRGCG